MVNSADGKNERTLSGATLYSDTTCASGCDHGAAHDGGDDRPAIEAETRPLNGRESFGMLTETVYFMHEPIEPLSAIFSCWSGP